MRKSGFLKGVVAFSMAAMMMSGFALPTYAAG